MGSKSAKKPSISETNFLDSIGMVEDDTFSAPCNIKRGGVDNTNSKTFNSGIDTMAVSSVNNTPELKA